MDVYRIIVKNTNDNIIDDECIVATDLKTALARYIDDNGYLLDKGDKIEIVE